MPTENGQLIRRQSECRSQNSCHSWKPVIENKQMPESAGDKTQIWSWNLSFLWVITAVAVALHLLVVFVLFPMYEDAFGSRNHSHFHYPASLLAGNKRSIELSSMAVENEEIRVHAINTSFPESIDSVINLDHGDPTMYEMFWREAGKAAEMVIPGSQTMSYFSDVSNLCWFLEPTFAAEIRRLHVLVGNAMADPDRYIVVGTGSSQLFLAALFALSTSPQLSGHGGLPRPLPVVSSAPYYSTYPAATDLLQSGLFRWSGDALSFKEVSGEPFIEVVCSPGNPDGLLKTPSASSSNAMIIYDLAYYWPQYTSITIPASHDIMLFTVSKCTGHAGMRLGWAIVKDRGVAERMTKFIEVSTIGVSKDSQLRAAKILKVVSDQYDHEAEEDSTKLFHFGKKVLRDRWRRLREAVAVSGSFSLPEFQPAYCNFMKECTLPFPAFAWLKCEGDVEDCGSFFRQNHKILTRSGKHFGADTKHVRISMLDRVETFDMFIERLSSIKL